MLKNWKTIGSAGAVLALCVLAQGPAQATDYTFSSFLPPDHVQTIYAGIPWAEDVAQRTNGEVNFKYYPGGAILPAVGVLKGLQEGVVQAAFVTAGYVPAEMPLWNLIGDMGWLSPDDMVIGFAAAEFGFLDEYGKRDWVNNNVVYGGTTATPVYYYMCKGKLQSLADFSGVRIRTPGNAWSRFAEHIGAVSVNVPSSEAYAAMERGALDCGTFDLTALAEGTRIGEVSDSVTMLKMGPFFSQSTWTFNKAFWNGLSTEQRASILDANARAMVRYFIGQNDVVIARNIEAAKEKLKVEFVEPAADLQAAYDSFVASDLGGLSKIGQERGVPDHEEGMAHFAALVEKWKGLMEGVNRSDEEALYKLIRENIFDKLDPASYGVN